MKARLKWWLARTDEWILFILAIVLFVVATNTQTGWLYAVSAGLVGLLIIGYLSPRRHLRGLTLTVELPPLAQQNEPVVARLKVEGPLRERILLRVPRQAWEVPGPDRHVLLDPAPGVAEVRLEPALRGAHRVVGAELTSTEPLGFFPARRPGKEGGRAMLVYPRGPLLTGRLLERARERSKPSGQTSRRAGSSLDLRRLRPYQQGEDIRHVHWPSSARGLEMMVREFQEPGGRSLCLIVDNRREFGEYPCTSLEEVVKAAAALAHYAHRHQLPLTFGCLLDGWILLRQPRLEQVLEVLARVRREEGTLVLTGLTDTQEMVVLTSDAQALAVPERARVLDFGPGGPLRSADQLQEALR